MVALGRTRDQVDRMTLFDVLDLVEYWRKYPPLVELLVSILGVEEKQPGRPPSLWELEAMAAQVNQKRR